MDDNKFWLSVFVGSFLVIFTGIASICFICKQWDAQYIEAGYTKVSLPGMPRAHWVAPTK